MRIMIVLKNIKKNSEKITCMAYIEDCDTPISLCFDRKKKKIEPFRLPDDYAWCTSHIHHAERYFCIAEKSESPLPQQRTIMWV